MHVIFCPRYYTLWCIKQTCKQAARCISFHASKHALKYTPDCIWLTTPSLFDCIVPIALYGILTVCLTYALQSALRTLPSTLQRTPPGMFSSTLPGMLSYTLSIALDGTLPACLSVSSQLLWMAHSRPAWLYTPNYRHKMLPSTLRVHSPVLPQACFSGHIQLHSMAHSRLA